MPPGRRTGAARSLLGARGVGPTNILAHPSQAIRWQRYRPSTYDIKTGKVDFHFDNVMGSVSMQGPGTLVGSLDPTGQLLILSQPATFSAQQNISGASGVSIDIPPNAGDDRNSARARFTPLAIIQGPRRWLELAPL